MQQREDFGQSIGRLGQTESEFLRADEGQASLAMECSPEPQTHKAGIGLCNRTGVNAIMAYTRQF